MTGGSQEKPGLFVTTTQIKEICLLLVVGCQDSQARAWPQGGVGLSRALLGCLLLHAKREQEKQVTVAAEPTDSVADFFFGNNLGCGSQLGVTFPGKHPCPCQPLVPRGRRRRALLRAACSRLVAPRPSTQRAALGTAVPPPGPSRLPRSL